MNLRCPYCHAKFPVEALTQDEAARELLGMRATMLPSLLSYLTLFRTGKRDLPFDRALTLAKETMALATDSARLEAALANTVESLRQKRENGAAKPLKDHKYLLAVLENTRIEDKGTRFGDNLPTSSRTSRRADAIDALSAWAEGDWLRWEIGIGLSALVAQSLKMQPGADMITKNADIWFVTLKKVCTVEEVDGPRIRAGFERLFGRIGEWPAPKQLLELMPARPPRQALREPPISEEEHQRGLEKIRQLKDKMGIT